MDNFDRYQKLNEDDLIDEIQKLNKRLFKIKPSNPMFNQLKNLIQMAEMAYKDKIAISRMKDDKSPSIIEIGNIEGTYNEVDYSPEALLNLTVDSYTKTLRGKPKKS